MASNSCSLTEKFCNTIDDIGKWANSVAKTVISCGKNIVDLITELLLSRSDKSGVLLTTVLKDLQKLKSLAENVLEACKDLARIASDDNRMSRIKEEIALKKPPNKAKRMLTYVQGRFFHKKQQQESELKEFVSLVQDRTHNCVRVTEEFYSCYDTLHTNVKTVMDEMGQEEAAAKTKMENKAAVHEAAVNVFVGSWFSGVAFGTLGAVASVFTGGAALAGVAATGFVMSWATGFTSGIVGFVNQFSLHTSQHEYLGIKHILQGILSIQQKMNALKLTVVEMKQCIQNTEEVLYCDYGLSRHAEQVYYEDTDRCNIETLLDDLQDHMKDILTIIDSYEQKHK